MGGGGGPWMRRVATIYLCIGLMRVGFVSWWGWGLQISRNHRDIHIYLSYCGVPFHDKVKSPSTRARVRFVCDDLGASFHCQPSRHSLVLATCKGEAEDWTETGSGKTRQIDI